MLELMEDVQRETWDETSEERTVRVVRAAPPRLLITMVWFGLVSGWLELGAVVARRAVDPRVSIEMLRTNRHFAWMTPAGDLLIFALLGLLVTALGYWLPGLVRWVRWRLAVALTLLTLLLTIEGLYTIAAVILALGVGSWVGPALDRRARGLVRIACTTLPILAGISLIVGLVVHNRVISAERRALAALPPAAPGAVRKNVLLIVLDNVRAASMSLYGHDRPTTPNLARLATRGVLFREARSPSSWTLPSRASMFTGQWPHKLSADTDRPLDESCLTLAEHLAACGYTTAGFVGNTYYCNALYGLERGFARYQDCYENEEV